MPLTYDVPVALHAAPPAHVQPGRAHAQFVKGAAKSSPAARKKPTRKVKNVTIRPGDSVYAIARTHSSSVAAIVKANPKIEFRRLVPGTVLKVPVPASTPKATKPVKKQPVKKPSKATSAKPVKKPAAKPAKAPAKKPTKKAVRHTKSVTVRPGDSLYTLAQRHHASLASVIKANPGLDARRLHVGSQVKIPVAGVTSAAKPAKKPTTKPARKPTSKAPAGGYAPKPTHVVKYAGTSAARRYPASAVASGDRHRQQLAQANLPNQAQIRSMIVATAKRYGVDPTLALAIGWQESGHRQSAVSVCDALDTMQVMPATGRWAGDLAGRKLNLMDPQDNITAGVVTLRFLTQHANNRDEVIGSYYQGLGAVRKHGFYPDTRQYVSSVKAHMKRFGG